MGFKLRKSVPIGPIRVNFTEHGFSSITIKVGPFSWNSRTRKRRVDTPGPADHYRKGDP